jgi:hypothetical protein
MPPTCGRRPHGGGRAGGAGAAGTAGHAGGAGGAAYAGGRAGGDLRGSAARSGAGLPRVETLVATPRQRLDAAGMRLGSGLGLAVARSTATSTGWRGGCSRRCCGLVARQRDQLTAREERLGPRDAAAAGAAGRAAGGLAARLAPALARLLGDAAGRKGGRAARAFPAGDRLEAAPVQRFRRLPTGWRRWTGRGRRWAMPRP